MSSKTFLIMLCTLFLAVGAACGDDSDDSNTAGMSGGDGDGDGDGDECDDAPSYDEVTAFETCTMCHSSALSGTDRNGAPSDHNFETYEGATEFLDHILDEVEEGKMPPAGSGKTITTAEREQLILWAECDGPE